MAYSFACRSPEIKTRDVCPECGEKGAFVTHGDDGTGYAHSYYCRECNRTTIYHVGYYCWHCQQAATIDFVMPKPAPAGGDARP